jgi:hypothetical protein
MTIKSSGFADLKILLNQALAESLKNNNLDDDIIKEEIVTAPAKINYQYPQPFQNIRSKFGGPFEVYDDLKRGVAILSKEEQLAQYLYSFGNMHEAKLKKAYGALFKSLDITNNKKIKILDYACGQGLATIVLLNYLESNFNYCISNILKIILVEPSQIALKRAKDLLSGASALHHINKGFDDVVEHDLKTDSKPIKIHLFSNILDMGGDHFDIDNIANTVSKSQTGINYFVCVSALKKDKLDYFMSLFEGLDGFKQVSNYDGAFTNHQNWKIKYNIFKVGV